MDDDMIVSFDRGKGKKDDLSDEESRANESHGKPPRKEGNMERSRNSFQWPFQQKDTPPHNRNRKGSKNWSMDDSQSYSSNSKDSFKKGNHNRRWDDNNNNNNNIIQEILKKGNNNNNNKRMDSKTEILQLGIGLQNIQLELVQMITDMHSGFQALKENIQKDIDSYNPRFDRLEEMISHHAEMEEEENAANELKKDEIKDNYYLEFFTNRLDKLEKMIQSQRRLLKEDKSDDDMPHQELFSRFDELEKLLLSVHRSSKEESSFNKSIFSKLENLEHLVISGQIDARGRTPSQPQAPIVQDATQSCTSTAKNDELLSRLDNLEKILTAKSTPNMDEPKKESISNDHLATKIEKLELLVKKNGLINNDITEKFASLEKKLSTIQSAVEEDRTASLAYKTILDSQIKHGSNHKAEASPAHGRKTIIEENSKPGNNVIKIPKSGEVEEILLEAMESNTNFPTLSDDELMDLLDSFSSAYFNAGSIILSQGDTLENFYVIATGTVDIFVDGEFIGSVSENESFGEASLLLRSESTSTFRAKEDCNLWIINRNDFRAITGRHKRNNLDLKAKLLSNVKVGPTILGDIMDQTDIESLALAVQSEFFSPEKEIIKEGEKGDTLYIIENGEICVYNKAFGSMPLATLVNGGFFGENILVNELTTVTCVTQTDVNCFTLKRDDFVRLVGDVNKLLENHKPVTETNIISEEDEEESEDEEIVISKNLYLNVKLRHLDTMNQIGQGRFSTVELVRCNETIEKDGVKEKDNFALKCISKQKLNEERMIDYVMGERDILKDLDHTFIIKLYNEYEDSNYLYFLLELITGEELYDIMKSRGPLQEDWTRFYAASVVLAFANFHKKKILHRDLKPENMMIDSFGFLKITKFSMAKKLTHGKTWTLCGTPDYFAPEVILNEGYDWGVDYWQLGVLIFELTAASTPFSAGSDVEVCDKILAGAIEFPPNLTANFRTLVYSLCKANQWKRLGRSKGGFENVKKHSWFSGMLWEELETKNLRPPYFPSSSMKNEKSNSLTIEAAKEKLSQSGKAIIPESCAKVEKPNSNSLISPSAVGQSFISNHSTKTIARLVPEKSIKKNQSIKKSQSIKSAKFDPNDSEEDSLSLDDDKSTGSKGGPSKNEMLDKLKGYSFGKNRYEDKLKNFLLNQRKVGSSSSLSISSDSETSEEKRELDINNEEDYEKIKENARKAWKLAAKSILKKTVKVSHDGEVDNSVKKSVNILGSYLSQMRENDDTTGVTKSFDQFFLLSIAIDDLNQKNFDNFQGSRFMDPFICRATNMVDYYSLTNDKKAITAQEVSGFCFPSGLRLRLIPRYAVEGARRLGWMGENSDIYKVHYFTNAHGESCYGVSITVREECTYPLHAMLKNLRAERKAATTLARCFRKWLENKQLNNILGRFFKKRDSNTENTGMPRSKYNSETNLSHLRAATKQNARSTKHLSLGPRENLQRTNSVPSFARNFSRIFDAETTEPDEINESAKESAAEAYKRMTASDKFGEVIVVERCYVLIGIRLEELSLLLCGLQNLVDYERKRAAKLSNLAVNFPVNKAKRGASIFKSQAKKITKSVAKDKEISEERQKILKAIHEKLFLLPFQSRVKYPDSQLDHVQREMPNFDADFEIPDYPPISLPLPLPHVSSEYGVGNLLLRIQSSDLLLILDLLLLERSVLVIGTGHEDVTTCTVALLDLLKPFKWASAFMPLIPYDMLDFVGSPVPFLGGIIVNKENDLSTIEGDYRVKHAMAEGLSVLNLNTGVLNVTSEGGVGDIVTQYQCVLRNKIGNLQKRLHEHNDADDSNLKSFKSFFRKGLSAYETLTISSIRQALFTHYKGLFNFVSENPEEWEKYGRLDKVNGAFEFLPARLLKPLQSQLQFQEIIVHTQLFHTYVQDRKGSYLNTTLNAKAALRIASWAQKKWRKHVELKSRSFLDSLAMKSANISLPKRSIILA